MHVPPRYDAVDDYGSMPEAMAARARHAPGFVSIEGFTAPDGERLSIVVFESAVTQAAWRQDERHAVAQKQARALLHRVLTCGVRVPPIPRLQARLTGVAYPRHAGCG